VKGLILEVSSSRGEKAIGTRTIVVLVSILALLLASCDSGNSEDKSDFARSYRNITEDYRSATTDIQAESSAATGQGLERLLGVYERFGGAVSDALDSYEELDPPSDFEDPFDEMVATLARQEEVLQELIEAARDEDTEAVAQAAGQLTQLTTEWNTARQEVEEKLADCGEPCNT
jgi:hypothetical protein